MTLAFYLTLENPDILRSELTEQKMSMLYLKSQVNPHFLYNTLDTIRIQAQLNGDEQVASLLMRLVSFFRRSVKVDRPQVRLEDELELIDAYLDLMCMRYPALDCAIDVAPELLNAQVPNFILQPLVENSLLHGLKGKGYRGTFRVSAEKQGEILEILVADSGTGFAAEKKQEMDEMRLHYDTWEPKLTGHRCSERAEAHQAAVREGLWTALRRKQAWRRDGAAQFAMEGGRSMKLLRVLLVDDEIKIREGFKRLFDWQAHGCEVVGEAADGVQALSQMEELKPDIVVMDINIPRMNGLKAISL